MKVQKIKDIAANYKAVFSQWKRAFNASQHTKLGPLEERLELMYDDVGKALLEAVKRLEQSTNNRTEKAE